MKETVQPYLFFGGRCAEALEFYKSALGAKVEFMMRNDEMPEPPRPGRIPAGWEKKICHCTFRVGNSTLMGSDGCEANANFDGFSLGLSAATDADAEKLFNALALGGQIKMPLTKTFWTSKFGMLTDKFGVGWMVSVEHGS
jgi:PhnB protein